MVVAVVGVIAGSAMRTEFAPVDRAIARWMLRVDRRWERGIVGGVRRVEEEWNAEAFRLGTCKTAMQRGAIAVVRPDLRDVAEVDDQCIGARLDEVPRGVLQNLEARLSIL